MIAGQLEIQLMANMARLTSDMDKAKRTVGGAVDVINKVLGTIGVGLSANAFAGFIKGAINAADETNKLAQKINVAVHEVAGLELAYRQAGLEGDMLKKSIATLSKNIADGNPILAKMGINVRDLEGNLRPTRQILSDVSDRFAGYADNANKSRLAQELFGSKLGTDMIPLLNQGSQALLEMDKMAEKLGLTISAETAAKSERFNDTLDLMGMGMQGISRRVAAEMIPTFSGLADQFFNTMSEGNRLKNIADSLSVGLKGLVAVGIGVAGVFSNIGTGLGGVAAVWSSIINGDFKSAAFIVRQIKEDLSSGFSSTLKGMQDAWNATGSAAFDAMSETNKQLRIQAPLVNDLTGDIEKSTIARKEQIKVFDMELYKLKQYEQDAKRARDITESVATKQEKYNRALEELERLKPYLEIETYNRKLQALENELNDVGETQRNVVNEMDQLWIQAGRNIQSSFSNYIFDFFSGRSDDMVRDAKNAVLRIAAEFAALKLANVLGIAQLFGATGTASGGSSTAGLLASIASMFSGARTGNAGVFNANGGAGTAFIGGAGTAIGGSGTSKGSLSGMGSVMSLASLAGPYGMAVAAAFTVLSALEKKVGDYELKGGAKFALGAYETFSPMAYAVKGLGLQTPEALIGKFLFGRGPYKFRQQSIQGDITSAGLDGTMTDVFRSRGAVFTSNRHRSFEYDIPSEVIRDIDKSIKGIYQSSHEFAANLGLDASLVDSYTKEIQVKSEKGRALTTQAIGEMLTGLSDEIAKSVMPNIDDFRLTGESAGKAFERLNSELDALKTGVENLGGSVAYAKQLIDSMSIDDRSALIDRAGGIDRLGQLTSGFFDGFLTDAEKLAVRTDQLSVTLSGLGLSPDITREQYKALVQSAGASNDLRISLLELVPAFLQLRDAQDQLAEQQLQNTGYTVSAALGALQRSIDSEKTRITDEYNKAIIDTQQRIDSVTASIGKLKSLSDALKSTTDALRPIGFTQARAQIQAAIANAKTGIFPDASSISGALSALTNQSTDRFSSRLDFILSRAQSARMVDQLGMLTGNKMTEEQRMLDSLESNKLALTDGFNAQIAQLDGLLISAQQQIDIANGTYTAIQTVGDAIGNLNRTLLQLGVSTVGDNHVLGNAAISNQVIVDYFKAPRTPAEIASDAAKYGVTSSQIMGATGYTQAQVDQFFADNPSIPRFASGSSYVPRTGPAIVHQGERIINPQQNGDIVDSLKTVVKKTEENTAAIGNLYRLLRNAMQETSSGFALTTTTPA